MGRALLIFALALSANAATYYVDNCVVTGSDSNNGTSTSTPWLTISKVNGVTLASGDSVLFNRGCTWREQLTHNSGGVTYGAYGTGAAPIITGADVFGSWTSESITYPLGHDFTTDASGDKPASWWMFQDSSSPSLDGSTNGNNLAWSGGTCSHVSNIPSGHGINGAYSLNTPFGCYTASIGYSSLSTNFPFKAATTAVTIGGWVYLLNSSNAYQTIVSLGDGVTSGWRIRMSPANNQLQLLVAGISNIPADTSYSAGWHHVVYRWNGDNRVGAGANNETSFWIDGVKQSTISTSGTPVLATSSDTLTFNGTTLAATNWVEWFVAPVAYTDSEIGKISGYGLANPSASTATFTDYYASTTTQPRFVLDNGAALTPSTTALTPLATGGFYWDSGTNRIHVRLAADASPTGHVIEASQRLHAMGNGSLSNMTIQDLDLRMANGYGLSFSDHLTLRRCAISYTYGLAVYEDNGYAIIDGNNISHSQAGGIQVAGGNNVISNNTITYTGDLYQAFADSYPGGIIVSWPGVYDDGTQIFGNVIHDTNGIYPYSHGMYVGQDASNASIHDNIVYNSVAGANISARFNGGSIYKNTLSSSGFVGISVVQNLMRPIDINIHHNFIYGNHVGLEVYSDDPGSSTINLKIYNNTFYQQSLAYGGNPPIEMQFVNDLTSVVVRNNIFWASNTDNLLWSVNQSALTMDHNIYYRSDASTSSFYYNGVERDYSWWAANVDSSPFVDPKLTSPTGNFSILAGSPAVRAGIYIAGLSKTNPPDIGAFQTVVNALIVSIP